MRYIKHIDPKSTYALHVLNNKHGYGLISNTVFTQATLQRPITNSLWTVLYPFALSL